MRTQTSKFFLSCVTIFVCCVSLVIANEDIPLQQHYVKIRGDLPNPLDSFELEIELESESRDVELFKLFIGDSLYEMAETDIKVLKNVELSTLEVVWPFQDESDVPGVVIIRFRLGEAYRIEYEEDGKTRYHWGKDKANIYIQDGMSPVVEISPLSRWS